MEPTIDVYDQGASAFLLLNGVRLLRVNWGDALATYTFDNREGQAVASLKQWRRGEVQVQAREFCDAFRTIMTITKRNRPAPREYVNGARGAGAA